MEGYVSKREAYQNVVRVLKDHETLKAVKAVFEALPEIPIEGRAEGKEPLLESRTSVWHETRADGKSGFRSKQYEDWMCPTCGWFVGELYSGHGQWHIQSETSYCARCGQKIDWSKPKDEEKTRYEERKAKEREEWERKNKIRLDNMHEGMRRKYGMMGGE